MPVNCLQHPESTRCTARALHRLPALRSFRQSSLPQRAVHPVDIFGRKTVHAMNGVGLADRKIWPVLQKLCNQRLGVIDPTEERQRISLAELANAETINIGITEILERLLVLAPPPMACRSPQPPSVRGIGACQPNGLFRQGGAVIPVS